MGSYTKAKPDPAVCAGLAFMAYNAVLAAGTCAIPTGFNLVLGALATYNICADTSVDLEVTWSGDTITVTGGTTDTVMVLVYGLT